MTYAIAKTFRFSAAHDLPQLAEGHPCRNVHGHNYTATVVLTAGGLDSDQFVLDYGDLSAFKNYLDAQMDHGDYEGRTLTEYFAARGWGAPTAENLAYQLWHVARGLFGELAHTVVVQETPGTMAAYAGEGTPLVWTA